MTSSPRRIERRRAAEKLLLCEPVTPEQAVEFGIANAVISAGEVAHHARRMAERFNAPRPRSATRFSKF